MGHDASSEGLDEEAEVLQALRRSPDDRRLLLLVARLQTDQRDGLLSMLTSFYSEGEE